MNNTTMSEEPKTTEDAWSTEEIDVVVFSVIRAEQGRSRQVVIDLIKRELPSRYHAEIPKSLERLSN